MPRGRQLPPLVLTSEQHEQLKALSQSTSMPYGLVQRARIVLACAQGLTNSAVAGAPGRLALGGGQMAAPVPLNAASRDCMTNFVRDGRAPMMMKR